MAYRRLPLSTLQRQKALMVLYGRIASVPPANLPLRAATAEQVTLFYPAYNQKIVEVAKTLAIQANLTAQVVVAKKKAAWLIRDFIDAMQNAVRRGDFSAAVRSYYDLPVEKRYNPVLGTEQDVISWGEKIYQGELRRVAAGGAPITFPAIDQVHNATQDFKAKNTQQSTDKDAHDHAQETLAAENKIADKLIRRCWNEIETAFDEGDKPSLRRKAREWGVVYVERKKKEAQPADENNP